LRRKFSSDGRVDYWCLRLLPAVWISHRRGGTFRQEEVRAQMTVLGSPAVANAAPFMNDRGAGSSPAPFAFPHLQARAAAAAFLSSTEGSTLRPAVVTR